MGISRFWRGAWLCAVFCAAIPGQTEGTYQRAVAAFQAGRYEEVLALLDGGAEPVSARAANLRSVALMKLRRYDEALAANLQAQRLDPGNANYVYNAGVLYLSKGDAGSAERKLRLAVGAQPRSSRLHEGLGEALYKLTRFDEAEQEFRRAVELDPASPTAYVALAKLLYALGDRGRFETTISKALQLDPYNHLACYYYGKLLIEYRGEIAEGGKYIEKSCALEPGFAEGLIALGGVLSKQHRWAEAAAAYEKAASSDPANPQVYYLLSVVYRKLGNAERARQAIEEFNRRRKS